MTSEVAGGVSVQSLELIKQDDDFQSRKRKSPEMAYTITNQLENKVSPEHKRITPQVVDMDDILTKLGLPVNLDRLTKGQLLQELEIRGNTFFTMKSLKKELIDGLKDLLIEEQRQSNQINKESIQQTTNNDIEQVDRLETIAVPEGIDANAPASLPITTQVQPTPGKPVRKGSLMAEFRNLVNNSNTSITNNNTHSIIAQSSDSSLADNEASDKAAAEFQARQIRHRDSMARKSQVIAADKVTASHTQTNIEIDEQCQQADDSSSFDDDNMQSDHIQVVEEEEVEEEIQTPEETGTNGTTTAVLVTEVVTSPPQETTECIWQEVASPMREVERSKVEIKTTLDHHVSNHISKETTHSKPIITTNGPKITHGSNDKHATTTAQVSSSSNNVKAAVAALQKPKPISNNTLPSSKATTEEQKVLPKSNPSVVSSTAAAASMKTNVVSAPKPVTTTSTTSTWGSNKTNVSKPATTNATAATTTSNTSVASTTNTVAVVKKGIFSGMSMFGAKKQPVVASQVPTLAASASESKKVSAVSTTATTAAVVSTVKTTATTASVTPAFDINATTDDISPVHNLTSIKTAIITPTDNNDCKSSTLSAAVPPSTNPTKTNPPPTTIQNTATTAVKLKDAFVSKNMISNIVNNYNAIVAPKTNTVSSSENISVLKDITPTITNNNTTAANATNTVIVESQQHKENNNHTPSAKEYIIEDR